MPNLRTATALLKTHYGAAETFHLGSPWRTAAALVLSHGVPAAGSDWTWLVDTVLSSPTETASSTPAVLGRLLESHGVSPKKAKSLHALAAWWTQSGNEELLLKNDLEARAALRQATGLSLQMVDALL